MAYRHLEITNQDCIRTITVNRPDKLNALNRATLNELSIAFAQADQDDEIRVVILTGAGDKAFVAGADITQMQNMTPLQGKGFAEAGHQAMNTIEKMSKPVIARIQGYALGGGLELALASHLRIASEKAKFGQPEINLGLIPGFGATQRLPRIVGRAAALELCLTGKPIGTDRALHIGLVNQVVAPEQLDDTVNTLANQLAQAAPCAIKHILDTIIGGSECSLEQGLDYEISHFGLTFSTEDMREGTRAFVEKREAQFKGC